MIQKVIIKKGEDSKILKFKKIASYIKDGWELKELA